MPTKILKPGERRSNTEHKFEQELQKRALEYRYEPRTDIIWTGDKNSLGKKISPIRYTPDFVIKYKDVYVIIETKGYARAEDKLKVKIAEDLYVKQGHKFFMVTLAGHPRHKIDKKTKRKTCPPTCIISPKRFYLYKRKVFADRGTPQPTFWEDLKEILG